jgi:hypothetical protein
MRLFEHLVGRSVQLLARLRYLALIHVWLLGMLWIIAFVRSWKDAKWVTQKYDSDILPNTVPLDN